MTSAGDLTRLGEFADTWRDPDLERLIQGQPPEDDGILTELSVGIEYITDFWREHYLDNFIRLGGAKIKFVTGSAGSGKTHCLRLFLSRARERGFKTVYISAKDVWLNDFKEVYAAILKAVDLPGALNNCARLIVENMGYNPDDIPEGQTFFDYLSANGNIDALTKRELRDQISRVYLKNPRLDNNFAVCCSILTGGILGYPILEEQSRNLILSWLAGTKGVRTADLRKLGLSPGRVTKYNSRHMLRSLIESLKSAGYPGLVVVVDDLDVMGGMSSFDAPRYTRMRREDAYESIRELIDDIDTMSNVMFLFSFRTDLLENENVGLKSYQALWMRIQTEINSENFNRFADFIDMDNVAERVFTEENITLMSEKLAEWVKRRGGNQTAQE
ncbi:MAG: ATP-binding protein, partial [Clostridiales bacterium]|nr:ATP-binding protein [Clostridiales bacterium]